tara:strand:+ start:1773 stop:1979 length:207 start_codon:yes stop_codon:yes gene_type:complete
MEHKVLYSGTWESEGHSITYVINDDDTVNIEETFESGFRKSNITNVLTLDDAIEDQIRYIKLGYDKIS